jgi:hypothetical protein
MQGHSARDALELLRDNLSQLIARTLYPNFTLCLVAKRGAEHVGWIQTHPPGLVAAPRKGIPIKTDFGRLHFYVQMHVEAVKEGGVGYALKLREYAYKLALDPSFDAPSQFVWTNLGSLPLHLRFESRLHFDSRTLPLDELMVPTGVVPLQSIVRFLIVDLGAQTRCSSDELDGILDRSYRDTRRLLDAGPSLRTTPAAAR